MTPPDPSAWARLRAALESALELPEAERESGVYGMTFITQDYVRRKWPAAGFDVIDYKEAPQGWQDYVGFVPANVLDKKFADSKILVIIPLFVFVGYLMAESKTPQRIVRAASAVLRPAGPSSATRPRIGARSSSREAVGFGVSFMALLLLYLL